MLQITTETASPGIGVLKLAGEATIEHADQLREALQSGLNELEHLQVDGAALTAIDFFTLQLLCSAHRTSVQRKKVFTWHAGKPELVKESIKTNGFIRQQGCSLCPDGVVCMWI